MGSITELVVTEVGLLCTGIAVPALHDAFTEPGAGVRGVLDGQRVAVGQLHWVQAAVGGGGASSSRQDGSSSRLSFEKASAGQTVVYCGVEGRGVIGALAFADSLRWAPLPCILRQICPVPVLYLIGI